MGQRQVTADTEICRRAVGSQGVTAEFPVFQIGGTIAGDVDIVPAVFAVPVIITVVEEHMPAVGVDLGPVGVVKLYAVFHGVPPLFTV